MKPNTLMRWLFPFALVALLFIGACSDDDPPTTNTSGTPTVDMGFPSSLTGSESSSGALTNALAVVTGEEYIEPRSAHGPPHCFFDGAGQGQDPFQNGYVMTKFLVGMVAQWMCITDFMINELTSFAIPTNGTIQPIPPDLDDPDAPSGISITTDSATQKTIRLYFDNDTTTPGMYFSWNTNGGSTQGKLVITSAMMNDTNDANAPSGMRLDFTLATASQVADLFIGFPAGNQMNVSGFRTQVTKNLDTSALPIFTALGRMNMSGQFMPGFDAAVPGTAPTMLMYSISDSAGEGAAIASFANVGISFDFSSSSLGHLGHYLTTKTDKYFFTSAGASQWVNKSFTSATFQGGRTSTGPQLTTFEGFLAAAPTPLVTPYFSAGNCDLVGDECIAFFDSMFSFSTFGQEANSGSDPGGWRSTNISAVTSASYLSSICPGSAASCTYDSSDVFAQSFTPTN